MKGVHLEKTQEDSTLKNYIYFFKHKGMAMAPLKQFHNCYTFNKSKLVNTFQKQVELK